MSVPPVPRGLEYRHRIKDNSIHPIFDEEVIGMFCVKTFKGYEDKVQDIDARVNGWIQTNGTSIQRIVDLKIAMGHETNARSASGDLVYTLIYLAKQPISD